MNEDLASIESLKDFWGDDFEPLCCNKAIKDRLHLEREPILYTTPGSSPFEKQAW